MSNSLAAVHPELVAEWSEKNLPLTPDSITFGSNKKVWWKGACGHEWQTSVKARSNGEKYLNEEERSRVIQSLIELKNNLAAQGRYTDAVDDVLCKVLGAQKKKLKIEYI